MVKFFTSSIAALAMAALVSAQTPLTGYPPANQVPDVNSPEVQAWLKEIDLTGAPTIPLHKGDPPACPNPPIANECYWTCEGCAADDITVCGTANTWGLTFDDGPSTDTPKLLDYLKTQKLSATFFLIGSNVIQYPDTVKREIADGHHLASHTWSHHALTTLTNEQIVAEMKWTEKAVLAATGLRMKYMRPPYGDGTFGNGNADDQKVQGTLKTLGYVITTWDIATGDADIDDNNTPHKLTDDALMKSEQNQYTSVVNAAAKGATHMALHHDTYERTVKLMAPWAINYVKSLGYKIVPVATCLGDEDPRTWYKKIGPAAATTPAVCQK
ncbi:chitin deacetylase [Podila clonocystis]|nr:chitin deacetylase [Podila clonocystis]